MPAPSNILQAEIMRAGLLHAAAPLADKSYAPPRSDWLTGEFQRWFRQSARALGAASYTSEAGDCDDFADLYSVLARICHRRTLGNSGTAFPVGVLHFVSDSVGPHAVNVALTSDLGLVVIDPQRPDRLLNLTASEKASAWLLKI